MLTIRMYRFPIVSLLLHLFFLYALSPGGLVAPFQRPVCPTCLSPLCCQKLGERQWRRVPSELSARVNRRPYQPITNTVECNSKRWYPKTLLNDYGGFSDDETSIEQLEKQIVALTADLIRHHLLIRQNESSVDDDGYDHSTKNIHSSEPMLSDAENSTLVDLVKGRFMDLTCTKKGEDTLECLLFDYSDIIHNAWISSNQGTKSNLFDVKDSLIRGAVIVLQSLCVMGTQVGVKGPPEQLRRMVEHLADQKESPSSEHSLDVHVWNKDSVRRLKHKVNRTPALQLLSELRWKQTPQGAFDLLVLLGAWEKHEDLALLRSGFPIRFTESEILEAEKIVREAKLPSIDMDPDAALGIRKDLRHLKVYTIDGAAAEEIDDGISIEKVIDPISNSITNRHRIWIHIADAESFAPPQSALFETARRRVTSLYLPHGSIAMFPHGIGTDLMSLKVNEDVKALSLGVEINDDGSVNQTSLIVTSSLIRVSFRLTYDEVDEMLEEGSAYNEEWEIGALLAIAKQRRLYRIQNGSSEGMVPHPVPTGIVSIFPDADAPDNIGISINIETSHNAALNKTVSTENNGICHRLPILENPVSSAYLLVTELMILAGEAMGIWKLHEEELEQQRQSKPKFQNVLRLPFRSQRHPDFKGRPRERMILLNLLENNVGNGLCHAWYTRRFLDSVLVSENQMPHSGLGLSCYVQWSSPIRRFSDLQVHAAVKRYLRRRKVFELQKHGEGIPQGVRVVDLGMNVDMFGSSRIVDTDSSSKDLDADLNFLDGVGLIAAGKKLQRQSQQYWIFEFIRRLKDSNPEIAFSVVVLGCVDPEKYQFAIYVKELGLEHRYISPAGRLEPGTEFRVKVDNVSPRSGLLSFVRIV